MVALQDKFLNQLNLRRQKYISEEYRGRGNIAENENLA
jgi:hypothetical protein